MALTRRSTLQLIAAAGGLALGRRLAGSAAAQDPQWRHGLSLFGDVKYGTGFRHFDYVNPNAPKGGRVRLGAFGSFDSLNIFTFKGEKPAGVSLVFDALMTASFDEPSTEYGLLAEAVAHPDDFSSVTYRLRPQARWHDGKPVTAEDVIFSMTALKAAHPFYAGYYKNVTRAEQTGEREVTFRFDQKGNRELPQITGQVTVVPKHWWTGAGPDGAARNIDNTTFEPLLGCGAYQIADVKPGRLVAYRRAPDYWGRDLPVNAGQNNFDEIIFEYYRDDTVAFEAFKADQYDWRTESSAKNWATGYAFPAVERGEVVLEKITLKNGEGMQSFAFNIRRAKFKDPRVRHAFNYAFDFEWANKNLFFGQYTRTGSYFSNSELACSGLPQGRELEILEPLRGKIPAEVFTTEFKNPVNETPQDIRNNLRAATKLLQEAGWSVKDGVLTHGAGGERMEVEFLLVSPLFERIVLPYVQSLEKLGIRARTRVVDTAQYQRRTDEFDFDIVVGSWGQSLSPGNEQRDFWGTAAADQHGSRNLIGIKDAAIDQLIDRVIFAKDREQLVAATRALDRVLLWNHFVVPQYHIPYDRTARWNRFGRPAKLPDYQVGFPTIWWWDAEKAAKVKGGG
jgi:microcin C transport system substrate-binding protein